MRIFGEEPPPWSCFSTHSTPIAWITTFLFAGTSNAVRAKYHPVKQRTMALRTQPLPPPRLFILSV
ncbi:hypothetical protein IAD21_05718 [Abditibacteriota bacterium]|nr:hypothetical protein IAD21_05718 [Abditibacteriota bacterium]